jgi:nucleoside-diphosphate-sugar epimerase
LNALKACAKAPLIKRFVFTSSSIASTFAKPNVELSLDENSYNEEALEIVKKEPTKPGMYIYAALKTATEKAMWKWMAENKPDFVFNSIASYHLSNSDQVLLTSKSFPT